ncbi:nose resistant to fluoxetine protein 6-like [Haemaphysalis longicornis]
MGTRPVLCFLVVSVPFLGFSCALSAVGGRMTTSNNTVPGHGEPQHSPPENLATTFRRWAREAVHNVPPWLKQRMLEVPLSADCSLALLRMLRGLSSLEPWAIRMVDSTGKVPSGLFTGTGVDLGSFDECLETVVRDSHSGHELVRAQYCSLYVRFPNDSSMNALLEPALLMTHPKAGRVLQYRQEKWVPGLRWGICVIAGCSQTELQMVAQAIAGDAALPDVKYCTTGLPATPTTSQIIVAALFGILFVLTVAGSIVDLYSTDVSKKTEVGVSILRSFSVPANLRLLTSEATDKTSEAYSLRFMHGIRAVSIFYIVFGHAAMEFSFATAGAIHIMGYLDQYDSTLAAAAIMIVDTFFFSSGYLLSLTLNRTHSSEGKVKTSIVFALRRWYRLLLPVVVVACGFSLLPLFVQGPTTTAVYDKFYELVDNHWWAFLFNLRNFYRNLALGVGGHLWFISADYQLFLVALIVHQLGFRKRVTVGVLAGLSVACCSFTAWQVWGTKYTPVIVQLTDTLDDYMSMATDVYMLPTYHAVYHFGGCITYFVVQKYKSKPMSKLMQVVTWVVAAACSTACVVYRYDWTRGEKHGDVAKVSLAFWDRIIGTIALGAFTFLCATKRGRVVQSMLSCAPLAVLSRLSFGVYLIHFPFFDVWRNAGRERTYLNVFNMFSSAVVVFVWSCLLAMCLFLACEAPCGRLDKLLWGPPPPRQPQQMHGEGKAGEHVNGRDLELGPAKVSDGTSNASIFARNKELVR